MTQTIGQRLKAEREEQRLTLEKAFEATRIRVQYLQALEADDISNMPSPVQARGYLRNYAEFLGFDADQMLGELRALSNSQPAGPVIGPADAPVQIPPPETAEHQPGIPISEDTGVVEETPANIEETDTSLLPPAPDSVTVPVKSKPARRKKTDTSSNQSGPDSAEPVTRRRGHKSTEPEIIQVVPAESEWQSRAEETLPANKPLSRAEEAAVPTESILKPVVEAPVAVQPEASQVADSSDSLWQTWLNRLGSVLSGQMRRRTLVPGDGAVVENEALVVSPEPVVSAEAGLQDRPLESWTSIFKEIGRELRNRRELLSLHFDEVERNTHVKAHYLDALERGALDELPSTVQTRGMLSNYATFLDLDVDALLLRFADALQARHRERNPQKPPRKPGQPIIANMPPVRSFIAGDMIFGVGMAILLVGFAIWGVSRVMTIQSQQEVQPTAPSISDVLLASPDPSSFTATPTFLPVEAFPGEPTVTVEIPTQNVNADVQLNLVAVERTYMRVTVDGEVAFDGRVVPGNAYPFEAENQIEVLIGSGAAIRTVYNGRDLGLMGTFGQVVNNIYSGAEIITPTALPSTTPTITLTPTSTVTPTATLQSTNTSVPSSTAVP